MQSHWTYCEENYPEADVADPGLDHQVAQSIFRISIFYAYQSVDHDSPDEIGRVAEQLSREMAKSATDIIRYLSASNWSVCNAIWKSYLQNCSNAEARMETRPLRMIDNMTMNLDCLMSVIKGIPLTSLAKIRSCGIWVPTETGPRRDCCLAEKGHSSLDR
jgi:hypothetical protein